MAAEITSLSLDTCFDALGHADRRELLFALYHTEASTVDIDDISSDAGNAQLELYHRHLPKLEQCGLVTRHHRHHDLSIRLPKLEQCGLVTVQRGGKQVKPGPQFEAIHPLLRLLEAVIE